MRTSSLLHVDALVAGGYVSELDGLGARATRYRDEVTNGCRRLPKDSG